jgi:type I restriction enzyme S subunit
MEIVQPTLRFPEFNGNWKNKTLGEIFSIFNGYAFSSSASVCDGVLWVKIADVGIQEMKSDSLSYLPIELKEEQKKFLLKKGDYVIALTRPILNGKLKIAKINDFFDNSLLNQRVGKVVTSNNSSFVYNLLQKDLLIKSIENNISGSDPPNLSPNEIGYIVTYIPSLQEQTQIANFLSGIDEKINLLKEKKSLLQEYKKGIMQKIFNQEIRFKDDNGNDFEDWKEKSLSEVTVKKSSNISANKIEDNTGDYIIYGASGILKTVDFYLMEEDYISIVKDGAGVGRIFYCEGKTSVLGTLEMISPIENINTYFIYCLLNNIDFTQFVTGSTIPHIYYKDYSKVICGVPCLQEQIKIANFLSSIDEKIALVNTQIQDTQEYKKGLLQQMFV